jgi:hypothetical protein
MPYIQSVASPAGQPQRVQIEQGRLCPFLNQKEKTTCDSAKTKMCVPVGQLQKKTTPRKKTGPHPFKKMTRAISDKTKD